MKSKQQLYDDEDVIRAKLNRLKKQSYVYRCD